MTGVTRPGWLWLTLPILVLALTSSVAGLVGRDTYSRETPNWSGQAYGQDMANVVAYIVLGVVAVLAWNGSTRALLAWTGVIAYSVYAFAIYAFALHFNRLFLVYVVVLGLSVYALIGGLVSLDPAAVKAMVGEGPVRFTAILLIVIGAAFYLLWLSEVIPASLTGDAPKAVRDAGLLSSPVHVLDLSVLLPAAIAGGVLLLRRDPWGYVLAPTVLSCLIFLSIGIVAAMLVLRARGEESSVGVALVLSALTLVEVAALVQYLLAVRTRTPAPPP